MFDLSAALFWSEQLLAIAVILQSLEILFLKSEIRQVWKTDIMPSQILRLSCGLGLFISPDPLFHLGLLIGTLITARQFRGPFNGGSDIMTFHVLMALTLARLFPAQEFVAKVALGYLALQLVASYFIAGLAKLRKESWRSGQALQQIVTSEFYDVTMPSINLPWKILSYVTLLLELLFPLALVNTTTALIFLGLAMTFHLINFAVLGLNRFVFAWLAAYPALLWLAGLH